MYRGFSLVNYGRTRNEGDSATLHNLYIRLLYLSETSNLLGA